MFRDLKEYQEIQNLYEGQVYLSEEEENELFDIVESFDLTDDEIEYFVENAEEFYRKEVSIPIFPGLKKVIRGIWSFKIPISPSYAGIITSVAVSYTHLRAHET